MEVVCGCVKSEQLLALLKGSVLPLAAELLALEEREGTLLTLDDADAAQELVRVRQEGRRVYGRAQELLAERAWDALPEPARELVRCRQEVANCLEALLGRVSLHSRPSVVTWGFFARTRRSSVWGAGRGAQNSSRIELEGGGGLAGGGRGTDAVASATDAVAYAAHVANPTLVHFGSFFSWPAAANSEMLKEKGGEFVSSPRASDAAPARVPPSMPGNAADCTILAADMLH